MADRIYTGRACQCRPGRQRENCPDCEGTGYVISFEAMRAARGDNVMPRGGTFARAAGSVLFAVGAFRWHVEAHSIGNQHPYIALGGETWDSCGCLHDEIREHVPEAAAWLPMHLADAVTGEPMHAEANAVYWLAGAVPGGLGERYHGGNDERNRTPAQCLEILAQHLRVRPFVARRLAEEVAAACEMTHGEAVAHPATVAGRQRATARRLVADFCAAQRDRWESEATACVDWIVANAAPDLREEYAARVAWMREHWSPKARRLRAQAEEVKP